MCVAKRGQQAKRVDVLTFKRRLKDVYKTKTRRLEMFKTLEGAGRPTGRPADRFGHATLFSHRFSDPVFIDFYTILAPIVAPFWNIVHVFCIPFSSIEFALNFD